jgi:hypothetical protein
MFKLALAAVAFLSLTANAAFLGKYSDNVSKMSVPALTVDEKNLVVDQALLILDGMFVHRDLKIKDFGYDAVPALRTLKQNLATISDADFQQQMSDIFGGLHDGHTNYWRPKPFGCYSTYLPVSYVRIGDGSIVVDYVEPDGYSVIPDLIKVHVGDRIVSYNGRDIEDVVRGRFRSFTEQTLRPMRGGRSATPSTDGIERNVSLKPVWFS